jgi:outer membrane receptor protein involved in Fe transport
MRRRFGRLAAALTAAAVWFEASTGSADVRTDARREFRSGMALVAEGQYDEGITHLEQAYDILPHPNVLYNIALAHMYAGRADAALYYFERYKETAPTGDAQEVDALMATLRQASVPATTAKADGTKPQGAGGAATPTDAAVAANNADTVATIERTSEELRKLADASSSEALRGYAEELQRAAQRLRENGKAAPAAGTAAPVDGATLASGPSTAPGPAVVPPTKAVEEGMYEEEVVSASRLAQSPLDAPNATSIITAQDIRMTGLTNMAELLRRVAGVEVNTVTPNHSEISIRGLNRRQSNKVLLLLDGRPLRLDFLGTNWYEQLPVSIEDVERIEIIRGPASALYGADAFSGIISIITKAPGEGDNFVVGGGGNHGQGRALASFRGKRGDLSYHFGFGYKQAYNSVNAVADDRTDARPLTDNPDYAQKMTWANGEARYELAKKSVATVGGNVIYGDYTLQGLSRLGQVTSPESLRTNVYGSLTTPLGIRVATWWDHIDGNAASSYVTPGSVEVLGYGVKQDIADVDLSWSGTLKFIVPHTITIGGNYRHKAISWVWLNDSHTQNHFGAYLQDVMQVAKRLRVQFGARMDHHPLLSSLQFSPRGSVVYRFVDDQSLRVSVGRAFRGPSFLESYVELPNAAPLRGVTAWGLGNDKLDPESITSYELGYQNQASDYFALEANVYFNMVKDAILFTDVRKYTLGDFANNKDDGLSQFDPMIDAFPLSSLSFTNERATFRQLGGEVGARFYPIKGLDVYTNYSNHDTRPLNGTEKRKIDPVRAKEQQTSQHKVNLGVQYRAAFGLDVSADLSWFSRQLWIEQVTDLENGVRFQTFNQPSFVMLNGRLGYRLLNDRMELGVVGTNLAFNDKRQHPFGQPIDTRIMGTTKLRF